MSDGMVNIRHGRVNQSGLLKHAEFFMVSWTHMLRERSAPLPSFTILHAIIVAWGLLWGASTVQDLIGLGSETRVWLLDVDVERSFYTWFSQLLLALVGLVLIDTGRKTWAGDRLFGAQFTGLGLIFILLSADEGLSFHEAFSAVLSRMGVGGLAFVWVIPAAIVCAIGLILAIPFLRRLNPTVRTMMLASGGLFLFGALVMEAFGGEVLAAYAGDVLARPYRMLVGIEEGAEGLGVILFLLALGRHRDEARLSPDLALVR